MKNPDTSEEKPPTRGATLKAAARKLFTEAGNSLGKNVSRREDSGSERRGHAGLCKVGVFFFLFFFISFFLHFEKKKRKKNSC